MVSGLPAELARPIVERGLIEADGGWQWRSDPRLTRPSAVRLAESQIHALLRGIEAPAALLLAQTHHRVPAHCANAGARRLRANIVVSHLDGGHHLHLEQPAAVAAWIEAASSSLLASWL
jgi:pimeloyl-ACP methyl ester carboxylesterase